MGDEIGKAIGLFWDIENCHVPRYVSAFSVVQRMRERFFVGCREAEFMCVCDITKESKTVIKDLNNAQVNVVHVSSKAKNAADDKIRQSLRRFSDTHPPGSHVVLISGDVNFSPDLSDLRHRKHLYIVLIHRKQVADSLVACANEHHLYEEITADLPALAPPKNVVENRQLIVTRFPPSVDKDLIKKRLLCLTSNCGGKVTDINNVRAVITFPTSDPVTRAKRRLDGEYVYGQKISVITPNQGCIFSAKMSNGVCPSSSWSFDVSHTNSSSVQESSRTQRDQYVCGLQSGNNEVVVGRNDHNANYMFPGTSSSIKSCQEASLVGQVCSSVPAFDLHDSAPVTSSQFFSRISVTSVPKSYVSTPQYYPSAHISPHMSHLQSLYPNLPLQFMPWPNYYFDQRQNHHYSNVNHHIEKSGAKAVLLTQEQCNKHRSGVGHTQRYPRRHSENSSNRLTSCWQQRSSSASAVCEVGEDEDGLESAYIRVQSEQHRSDGHKGDPHPVDLLVTNLDYNISKKEWRRILAVTFEPQVCVLGICMSTLADNTSMATVKVPSLEQARLAISLFHRRKIGYKRINIGLGEDRESSPAEGTRQEAITILSEVRSCIMPVFKFIENYERRYHKCVSVSDLYKLKDVVEILDRGGAGRMVRLARGVSPIPTPSPELSMDIFLPEESVAPVCLVHCPEGSCQYAEAVSVCMLPNVCLLRRQFSARVHSLLLGHSNVMPLMSFPVCYAAEFGGVPVSAGVEGVPMEHLISCVPGVELALSKTGFKVICFQENKETTGSDLSSGRVSPVLSPSLALLSREICDLLRQSRTCSIPASKFIPGYHHHFGRQCRVADYGYTKLAELFESLPHVLQVLGTDDRKVLTLCHRAQVKRFMSDMLKLLKSQPGRQLSVGDLPAVFERTLFRKFDITHYGVSFLEDMFMDIPPTSILITVEDSRTVMAIPKRDQTAEEVKRTEQFALEVVDLLRHNPQCCMTFNRFIPAYHHHFGRQCRVADFGFTRLTDLFECISSVVEVIDDEDEKMLKLTAPEMRVVVAEQIAALLRDSPDLCLPLDRVSLAFHRYHGFPLRLSDFGVHDVRSLVSKLRHRLTVDDSGGSPAVLKIRPQHGMPLLAMRVLQLLMEHSWCCLPLDDVVRRYRREYGVDCDVHRMRDELLDYVMVFEGSDDGVSYVRMSALQMLGNDICLLLKKGCLALPSFAVAYQEMFTVDLKPALYGYPDMLGLLNGLPHIVRITGRGVRKTVELAPGVVTPRDGDGEVSSLILAPRYEDFLSAPIPSTVPSPDLLPQQNPTSFPDLMNFDHIDLSDRVWEISAEEKRRLRTPLCRTPTTDLLELVAVPIPTPDPRSPNPDRFPGSITLSTPFPPPPPMPTDIAPPQLRRNFTLPQRPRYIAPCSMSTDVAPPLMPRDIAPASLPTDIAPCSMLTDVAPPLMPTDIVPPQLPRDFALPPLPRDIAPCSMLTDVAPPPMQNDSHSSELSSFQRFCLPGAGFYSFSSQPTISVPVCCQGFACFNDSSNPYFDCVKGFKMSDLSMDRKLDYCGNLFGRSQLSVPLNLFSSSSPCKAIVTVCKSSVQCGLMAYNTVPSEHVYPMDPLAAADTANAWPKSLVTTDHVTVLCSTNNVQNSCDSVRHWLSTDSAAHNLVNCDPSIIHASSSRVSVPTRVDSAPGFCPRSPAVALLTSSANVACRKPEQDHVNGDCGIRDGSHSDSTMPSCERDWNMVEKPDGQGDTVRTEIPGTENCCLQGGVEKVVQGGVQVTGVNDCVMSDCLPNIVSLKTPANSLPQSALSADGENSGAMCEDVRLPFAGDGTASNFLGCRVHGEPGSGGDGGGCDRVLDPFPRQQQCSDVSLSRDTSGLSPGGRTPLRLLLAAKLERLNR